MPDEIPLGERLDGLIADYLARADAGEPIAADDWAARHPDQADALRQFFLEERLLERVTAGLRAAAAPFISPEARRNLGDFRLVRELGRGGMGVVYEAEQLSLSRRVALKILPFAAMLDERQLQRFKNEARAAALLKHPHIVSVHAFGCERGAHFYVMDLVEGRSLAEVLERKLGSRNAERGTTEACDVSLPSPEFRLPSSPPDTARALYDTTARPGDFFAAVARLGVQVADALSYAHAQGVIHRDVKPSNLLLDAQGQVWVTDFGLARIQGAGELTMTGDVLGTLRYMSPEQLGGTKVVDERTDVYSLCLTLYELLTGRAAFTEANREQLIHQVLAEDPPPPRRLEPRIPRDLETIVLKATSKPREARYQSAAELSEDLQRYLDARPIRARRVTRAQRLRYWARRNPGVAALAATLLVVLSFLAVAGPYAAVRQVRVSNTLAERVYIQDVQLAYGAWEEGDVERVAMLLERHIPRPGDLDARGFEWRHLYNKYLASADNVSARLPGANAEGLCFSPSGLFAYEHDDHVYVGDTLTGRLVVQLPAKSAFRPVLSSDGRRLATGHKDGTIGIWDLATRKLERTLICDSNTPECMTFSPDGGRLLVGERGDRVFLWDVDQGELLATWQHKGWLRSVVFSPNGRLAASAGDYGNQVKIWDAHAGRELHVLDRQRAMVFALAFSPDGQTLAVAGSDEIVQLFDVNSGQRRRVLAAPSGSYFRSLAFSPDGGVLAASGPDRTIRYWSLATGRMGELLRGHLGAVDHVAFLDDTLVSAADDRTVRTWKGPWTGVAFEPIERGFSKTPIAYSPVGPTLAVGQGANSSTPDIGGLVLHNLATGEVREVFTAGPSVMSLACSPDGAHLAAGLGRVAQDRQPHFGEARVWKVATGELVYVIPAHEHPVYSVRFSPDGRVLATASVKLELEGEIKFWDVTTGKLIAVLQDIDFGPTSIDFSPDGALLAAAGGQWRDGRIRIWDWRRRELLAEWNAHGEGLISVQYSPDGNLLASGCWNNDVTLWDAKQHSARFALRGHRDRVTGIAFSPDGTRFASAAADRVVKLWHAETGSELAEFHARSGLTSVLFFPDGQTLAAGCADHSVVLWRADGRTEVLPAEQRREAHNRLESQSFQRKE